VVWLSRAIVRAAVLLALATVLGVVRPAAAAAQTASSPSRVLVVPFDTDTRQPRTYWLGEGASLLVSEGLEAAGLAALTREQRVRAFDDLHLPASASLTRATVIRVAQLVGASHAVFGTVAVDGTAVTITARPLVVSEGRFLPDMTEQGPLTELFPLARRLAGRAAAAIVSLPSETVGVGGTTSAPSLDAFEAYVKALITDSPELGRRLLRQALDKHPGYDHALLALWALDEQLGDHAAALKAARAVGEKSPLARQARFASALSQIELGSYDEAYTTLWALADERFDAPVLNNLGVIQLRRGATPTTGVPTYYFTKATEQDPDDPDLFFNLGYAYALERKPDAAVYWLREAVRRNPADGDAHLVLAESLQAYGAAPEAARERELARKLSARWEETERRSAAEPPRGLERLKPSLDAIHTVRFERQAQETAHKEQQELARFHLERARRLADDEKDGEALGELRRSLFLEPYNPEALLLTARLHLRMGQAGDAVSSARIALWTAESVQAHVVLGQALLEAKDPAGAQAEAERALALDPSSADARELLTRARAALR
jgi:tetratricopeptide (TPR) repeat protein